MFLSVIFAVLFVACYPCGIFPMDDSPRRDVLFFSCAPPLPPPGTKKLYTLVLDNHERALFPTKFVTILLGEKKNSRAVKWTEGLCHAHHPYGAAPPSPLSRAHWPLFAGVLAHHHDPALTRCVARMKGFSGGPRMIFWRMFFLKNSFLVSTKYTYTTQDMTLSISIRLKNTETCHPKVLQGNISAVSNTK